MTYSSYINITYIQKRVCVGVCCGWTEGDIFGAVCGCVLYIILRIMAFNLKTGHPARILFLYMSLCHVTLLNEKEGAHTLYSYCVTNYQSLEAGKHSALSNAIQYIFCTFDVFQSRYGLWISWLYLTYIHVCYIMRKKERKNQGGWALMYMSVLHAVK